MERELQGNLRAGEAAALRSELAEALAAGDVRIDALGLTGVDCAIVQVLLSARRTAAQLERNLQIVGQDGGALATMLERLALSPALTLSGPGQAHDAAHPADQGQERKTDA